MENQSERWFTFLLVANVVLWGLAIIASAIARASLLPIPIVGGGIGSIALILHLRGRPGSSN